MGRTFGVVLDTSGSMPRELLGKALGSIASYAVAHEVPAARVIFCDAAAYDAGYMAPEAIAERVRVKGRGGTVLQPGVHLLENAEDFPKDGPIKVLVGISAPGQNWSESRGAGVIKFLEEYKAANPNRDVSWERIDSGTDLAITSDRVGAYLNAHPDTTAYFDTGFWCAGVARVLADRGVAPGKVLLGGFDLVPQVLQAMQKGYVQALVDQQPYMQGFMPVMEVYLSKTVGLAPADIDTGQGIVRKDQVAGIMELSAKGLR